MSITCTHWSKCSLADKANLLSDPKPHACAICVRETELDLEEFNKLMVERAAIYPEIDNYMTQVYAQEEAGICTVETWAKIRKLQGLVDKLTEEINKVTARMPAHRCKTMCRELLMRLRAA
jgi:hypothetical protein